MKKLKQIITITLVFVSHLLLAQTKTTVASFDKVVISPHIETTFIQGEENSVTILENTMSDDIVNIEVNTETLRVYLDDAKEVTKHEKVKKNGMKMKVPIYKGKVLTIRVTYKNINTFSLRGEQRTLCKSPINNEKLTLNIYGESQVTFNEVNVNELDADIYGESQLTIKKGTIDFQKITAYGEAEINLVEVNNEISKLKAYGEAEFIVQSFKSIKFTSYGEAQLHYKGSAKVNRGLSFGDSNVYPIN